MPVRGIRVEEISCRDCPVGEASGAGRGRFCPFITRSCGEGDVVCRAGEPADYVWFVKTGVIGVNHSRLPDGSGDAEALSLPGSFIGLECLIGDRRLVTARALSASTLCGASLYGFLQWLDESPERSSFVMGAVLIDPLLVQHAQQFEARLSRPPEWGPDDPTHERGR